MLGSFSEQGGVRALSADVADRLNRRDWIVVRASTRAGRTARLADMLITAYRRRADYAIAHIDVFSGRAFLWAEAAAWLLRRIGKPYILTLRGGNLPTFAQRWPGRTRALLTSAAAVTAPSRYLQELMRPFRADVRVLPNGVESGGTAFRLRAEPRPQLIWLRRFHEIYNPALAPAVLASLGQRFALAQLTMIGPDAGDGSLARTREAARALGVADRVFFEGPIPKHEVPNRLAAADIFLNTTSVDNSPVTMLEAMASGLCVVSTCVGGIPYLVEDGKTALLVPPSDPAAMAEAVRRLIEEPGLGARLSAAGRRQAAEADWATVIAEWEVLLKSVVCQ